MPYLLNSTQIGQPIIACDFSTISIYQRSATNPTKLVSGQHFSQKLEDFDDESDCAIDDDDTEDWETDEEEIFERIDCRYVPRCSLLTSLMHGRVAPMPIPAIQRSRTSFPRGLLKTPSAQECVGRASVSISPRTTRQNMLSSELSESIRKNFFWERQVKQPPSKSPLIQQQMSIATISPHLNSLSGERVDWFDVGFQEYYDSNFIW